MALTNKQQAFINAYIVHKNATRAAKEAGYSEDTAYSQGSRLLKNVEIRDAIEAHFAEQAMSANEVISLLADHARGSMEQFIEIKGGQPFIDLYKAQQANKLHLLKKIKNTGKGVEIELYDAQAALVQLGRHLGLFVDKTELSGPDGGPIPIADIRQMSDDELRAVLESTGGSGT